MRGAVGRSRPTLIGLALLAGMALGPPSVGSAEPAGVTFIDQRPVTIKIPGGGGSRFLDVEILNGGEAAQAVTVVVAGLAGDDDDELPEVSATRCDGASEPPADGIAVGAAECWRVTAEAKEGLAGSFTAILAAYGEDGSVDRRELSISVAEPRPTGEPATQALRAPLPEAVPWRATSWLPSIARELFDISMEVRIPVSPQLAAQGVEGNLAGPVGLVPVSPVEGADEVVVDEVSGAGEYAGAASFAPDVETALTVRVADAMPYFILTVLIGLGIALWLDLQLNRREPRLRLLIALERIRNEAIRLQDQAVARMTDETKWPFPMREPWRVWEGPATARVDAGDGHLAEQAAAALAQFDAADDAAEARKTWDPGGEAVKKISELVTERQLAPQLTAEALAEKYAQLRSRLDPDEREKADRNDIGRGVAKAVAGRVVRSATDLDARKDARTSASGLVDAAATAVAVFDLQRERLDGNAAALAALASIREQVFEPGLTTDRLNVLIADARALTSEEAEDEVQRRQLFRVPGSQQVRAAMEGAAKGLVDHLTSLKRDGLGTNP